MSAGNALPAGAPPECRPVASPEPGRPGSCPRSSAYAMATWWSPFVDVPTGRFVPRRIKRIHLPANYPRSRDLTPLGGAVPSNDLRVFAARSRRGSSVDEERFKSFRGAQPPRKLRWTNAGKFGVGDAVWKIRSGRCVSRPMMAAQHVPPEGHDRGVTAGSGVFRMVDGVI